MGEKAESRYSVTWNTEQLKSGTNMLILFRVCEHSLTLLSTGRISLDVLDLETFIKVIEEGKKCYKNMIFFITNLTKEMIQEITKLLEVKHLGQNKYMFIIPLVRKDKYKVYSLIPHKLKIKDEELTIAEIL